MLTYAGEQVALRTLRSTGQMSLPAPIVAGDLLEAGTKVLALLVQKYLLY